jgi:protein TonB
MLVAFLLALAMQADDWVEPTGPEAAGAAWVAQPSHTEFMRAYPSQADWNATPGHAVLQCVFTAAGRLSDCAVVSEAPAGQRFGVAALKLARYFRAVAKPAGASLAGKLITLPITFEVRGHD